jgi:glucan biosynthesis protein C
MQNADATAPPHSPNGGSRRLHYLDWIRVISILGVFLYHTTAPFDTTDWHINNGEQTMVLTILTGFLFPFGMPLFFLVAGIGSWLSLQRRTVRQFVRERFRRLLVPFIIGSVLLTPIQLHFQWRNRGWFEGSFVDFLRMPDALRRMLETSYPLSFGPQLIGAVSLHLWFLGFLFVYSLLSLPLFLWLRQGAGRRVVDGLARLGQRRGGTSLFVVPLVLVTIALQPTFTLERDWPECLFMWVFFIAGHVLFADQRLREAIRRDWVLSLMLAIASYLVLIPGAAAGVIFEWMETPGTPGFVLFWSGFSASAWFWALFMLVFAMRYLDFRNQWLEYGLEGSLPFYVIHQPVMVVISYYVVQWPASVWLKLLIVGGSSFVVTLGLYELLVRRVKPVRALLGMRPQRGKSGG